MTGNIICILIAIVVYLVGMVAIGVYYSKGQSDAHEFYLGGRKLGPIVTALSTEASDMSAYLLMGVPGLAFFCGSELDGYRPCAWHLSQLAVRCKASAPLLGSSGSADSARVHIPPLLR